MSETVSLRFNKENSFGKVRMMKKLMLLALVAALVVPASAAVTGLYNTGVNADRELLGHMDRDLNYVLTWSGTDEDAPYAINAHAAWYTPDDNAMWIAPSASNETDLNGELDGYFTYTLTFTIDTNPENVIITGKWASDNSSEILVNGFDSGFARPEERAFESLASFTLSGDMLVRGDNTLAFVVYNWPQATNNPTGLLVTDLSATIIPAPGAILLTGIATPIVGWLRRRRSL